MARNKGVVGFSASFESQQAVPLDARSTTEFMADLYLEETWAALDGKSYVYPGMQVSVWGDTVDNNGVYVLLASPVTETANWLKTGGGSGSGGAELATDAEFAEGTITTKAPNVAQVAAALATAGTDTYTNAEGTAIEVGGIPTGTTFDGATLADILDMLLYPELFPTLTAPSFTFTEDAPALVEVGAAFDVTFTARFNRGSIEPAYETSGFRAGLPTQYAYTGEGLPTEPVVSTALVDTQDVIDITMTAPGTASWTASVTYGAGEQPLSSKGNNFDAPLAGDTFATRTVSVTAVYAFYATTADIATVTKQPLISGNVYEVDMVGETDTEKQVIEYALTADNALTGVEFFNTNNGKWEWLSASEAASLTNFDYEQIERSEVGGAIVQYRRYTNNTAKTGARQLRFHV